MASKPPQPANGRPEAEVIHSFQDGLSYSKARMDEALLSGILERPTPAHTAKDTVKPKKDDIDVIVSEMELSRTQAEKLLVQHGGDLNKALRALIFP
ncbi:hypothetical protein FRC03_002735 [Tulasnella sp. 419]|nr:hypothetical protein FRC02_000064 [Tulasnella sp. 418]KAG8969459.1 hypothetical protein FRC03_002735 [Tulasnella sp. 419]